AADAVLDQRLLVAARVAVPAAGPGGAVGGGCRGEQILFAGAVVRGGDERAVRGDEGRERGYVALACADERGAGEPERVEALGRVRRRREQLPRGAVPVLAEGRAGVQMPAESWRPPTAQTSASARAATP